MPLSVSTVTVVRNGESYLSAALGSILAQTYQPMERIVVVGPSTDRTLAIAHAFPRVRVIEQEGAGLALARNVGIHHARGDLIAFLDHDDLWHPLKLERQVALLRAQPDIDYCTTAFVFIGDEARQPSQEASTPGTLLARAALFEHIGGFDPRYQIGCDADWFTRVRDHNIPTALLPDVLFYKRLHATNLSKDTQRNRQEMFDIARRSIARRRLPDGPNPPHS